ncbi:hypothetical protein [Enterococcus faecium]|uniref:hypothetical protein n=1 Tax=Enterococcus faecium TaxID=1352 RepID=UPI0001CEBCB3|nr:hypothetical protein [Enterococcus faecium]EFF32686.1 gp19, putative [Enterococcus faecium E1039]
MGLVKLISNNIALKWKETFNKNVDYLNNLEKKLSDQDKSTNSRIDNLVLHSGGESPNEVVDARVNNKGEIFDTLHGRLLEHENLSEEQISELVTNAASQKEQVQQLNKSVETLVGGSNQILDIYVSTDKGSDVTGNGSEERPFATIQTAANQIPLIATQNITIWVDDGVYLEDVMFKSINANTITIQSHNNSENIDLSKSDLSVKVRSIGFYYCSGYFKISGLQFVDMKNSVKIDGTPCSVVCDQGGRLAIHNCKFADNVKDFVSNTVYVGGNTSCNLYGPCYFANQYIATRSRLLADVVLEEVNGKNNYIGMGCYAATIRGTLPVSFSEIPSKVEGNGLVITKATVLS